MTRKRNQFHFRTVSPDDGAVSWKEYRGCKSKRRHATKPECDARLYAYECQYCGGWHKASKRAEGPESKIRIKAKPIAETMRVLRGGYWTEK